MVLKHMDLSQTYTHLQANQLARAINEVIDKFNELQAKLESYRWIPVGERLPENGEFCDLFMPKFNSACPQRGKYG